MQSLMTTSFVNTVRSIRVSSIETAKKFWRGLQTNGTHTAQGRSTRKSFPYPIGILFLLLINLVTSFLTVLHASQFYEQQKHFPLKPIFQPSSVLTFDQDMVQQMPEKQLVQATLDQLNQVFHDKYQHSFTEAAIKHGKRQLERKWSKKKKMQERRNLMRKCRNKITTQLSESTQMMVLAENESIKSYRRKRARLMRKHLPPRSPRPHTNPISTRWNGTKREF